MGIYIDMEMPKDGYIDVRVFAKGHANIATGEPPFYKEMPAIEVPSADVVEVVRCKDCSHGYKTSYPSELRICLMTGCANSENHFCSDGKRMDGGI